MVRDVPVSEAEGLIVLAWRSGEEGLHLAVRGQPGEVRLRCRCNRSHWIVREEFSPGGARLVVSCHGCRTGRDFVLEGAELPSR